METKVGENANIRSPSTIYPDSRIGNNFTTGHFVLIRERCTIGNNVSIGSYTELSHNVVIADDVRIHSRCFIPEGTVIERGAWLGPCVCITNDKHPGPAREPGAPKILNTVIIEHHAVIGANVTILPGVVIGHRALVGAGAVVTKNVPPYATVVGNPARML